MGKTCAVEDQGCGSSGEEAGVKAGGETVRVGSLFSGIGGIDLGLEQAGMEIAWQVEIDEWCRRVLAKHWPDVERFGDIRSVGSHNLSPVDVLAGGFPCQPVSHAGKRQAQNDARWLWPEFARLVRELRPRYVFVENVPGLLDGPVGDVLGDLAACGYDAEWDCIPAAAVGAPHLRDRVWLLAYAGHDGRGAEHGIEQAKRPAIFGAGSSRNVADTAGARWEGRTGEGSPSAGRVQSITRGGSDEVSNAISKRQPRSRQSLDACNSTSDCEGEAVDALHGGIAYQWRVEPAVGRVAHGIPHRVDRLRGLGNAVVPQIVEYIGQRIMAVEASQQRQDGAGGE